MSLTNNRLLYITHISYFTMSGSHMKARKKIEELELMQSALAEKMSVLADKIKNLTHRRIDVLLTRCINLLMGNGEITTHCTDKKGVGVALLAYHNSSLSLECNLFMLSSMNACYRVSAYFEGWQVLECVGRWTKKTGIVGTLLILYTPGDWEDQIQKIRPKKWQKDSQ